MPDKHSASTMPPVYAHPLGMPSDACANPHQSAPSASCKPGCEDRGRTERPSACKARTRIRARGVRAQPNYMSRLASPFDAYAMGFIGGCGCASNCVYFCVPAASIRIYSTRAGGIKTDKTNEGEQGAVSAVCLDRNCDAEGAEALTKAPLLPA